jgi:hypothetical protein
MPGADEQQSMLRTLRWTLVGWVLVQLGIIFVDWSLVDSIDDDPKALNPKWRFYAFYLPWAAVGLVWTAAMLAWAWRRSLVVRALVWLLYGPVTLVWLADFLRLWVWRTAWSAIEHEVSSTMHTEANDALRGIVLTNFVLTLGFLLVTTAVYLVTVPLIGGVFNGLASIALRPPRQSASASRAPTRPQSRFGRV